MKNITQKALVLGTALLFTLTQANANLEQDSTEKLTKSIWETSQKNILTKEDSISNLAWTSQNKTLLSEEINYEIVVYADDLKDIDTTENLTKAIWETEKNQELIATDKISALAWSYETKAEPLTKEDIIANIAWTTLEGEILTNGKHEIVACAADLENKDPSDIITKAIWSR